MSEDKRSVEAYLDGLISGMKEEAGQLRKLTENYEVRIKQVENLKTKLLERID